MIILKLQKIFVKRLEKIKPYSIIRSLLNTVSVLPLTSYKSPQRKIR